MKNLKTMLVLGVALAALSLMAETETVDGVEWTYIVENGGAFLGPSSSRAIPTSTTGAISIPATLGGHPVVHICDSAFRGCFSVTSVTIPSSVTNIGANAFALCFDLTSVTIPEGVKSIEDCAFKDCRNLIGVTIPNSVTRIGYYAFASCYSLKSVIIPQSGIGEFNLKFGPIYSELTVVISEGASNIEGNAFYCCRGLTSVTIPNSVTNIGENAFSRCFDLASVTIPDSVRSIGEEAFYKCVGLRNVTIGDGVKSIGRQAFDGCVSLETITIPSGVTNIGGGVFSDCTKLTDVYMCDGIVSIGPSMFNGCSALINVTMPSSIVSIGSSAFRSCSGLSGVAIGDGVTSIGESAFQDCSGLLSVIIPNSVTNIGSAAFRDCSVLAEILMDNRVEDIGTSAFRGCSCLTNVSLSAGLTRIRDSVFSGCSGLKNVVMPNSVTSIGHSAFSGCSNLEHVSIPSSVRSIGSDAFSDCRGLAGITMSDSVASIGSSAFSGCSSLADITIPNGVTSIGDFAFYGCKSLVTITLPDSVTDIHPAVFKDCCGIQSIVIPSTVTNIMEQAFSGCRRLMKLTIPNGVTRIGWSAFSGCSALSNITIPDGVASIEQNSFSGCSGLENVALPNSVTSIGYSAFSGCRKLTHVSIPNSVRNIGSYAFSDCSSLEYVSIPDAITSVGDFMFRGCSGLSSISIPNGVTSIGEFAFYGCCSLANVTLPCGLTRVGSWAFAYCEKLVGVIIPDGITTIDIGAFYGCSSITNVTIPLGVTTIGQHALSHCTNLCSIVFCGNAPSAINAFYDCHNDCCAYVRQSSAGWGVTIPGKWNGINIAYVEEGDSLDTCIITFDANGGALRTASVLRIESGCTLGTMPVPVRDGYVFDGWFTAANGGIRVIPATEVSSSMIFYAHWREANHPTSFCWTDNSGRYTVVGVNGERFETKWSECAADSIYAYSDCVELVGVGEAWDDFPTNSSLFVDLDWEQRAPKVKEGAFVVFMNNNGQFLCVRVQDVKVKSRGDEENQLEIDYRVYNADLDSAERIRAAHIAKLKEYEIMGVDQGVASFCFSNNSGHFTVVGANGERFVTMWSECGADTIYAYNDYAKLIGIGNAWDAFPTNPTSFVDLDWEQRAPKIQEGAFVVFLNNDAQFLCVRVIDVQVKSRGDASDLVTFEYKIYNASPNEAATISAHHDNLRHLYTVSGNDTGTASFCFANNSGCFTIIGVDGVSFKTMWSECGADSLWAIKDYVKLVAVGEAWGGFPASSVAFKGLDWGQRARTVAEGQFVVFMSEEGRFLCLQIKEVKAKSRGADEDLVEFDYKIYNYESGPSEYVLNLARTLNFGFAIVKVDAASNEIIRIPLEGNEWRNSIKLIKTINRDGDKREIDISDLIDVPLTADGGLDLSKAEVRSEIVSEVLDAEKDAVVDINPQNPRIETAKTREGLTYEFYEAKSLDALNSARPSESKLGDGTKWTPNITVKGGTSAFYTIKVTK